MRNVNIDIGHFEGPDLLTFITLSPCLKKILKFNNLKSCRTAQFYYFLSIISSPWLKNILRFDLLKSYRMAQFYYFLPFTKNYEIWHSEKIQNGSILLLYPSPWLKKILNFNNLKSYRTAQFYYFLSINPSPWLKKILTFDLLKSSRMARFYYFINHSFTMVEDFFWHSKKLQNGTILLLSYQSFLHHGWRKFWDLTF